jgi:hypothetical protein
VTTVPAHTLQRRTVAHAYGLDATGRPNVQRVRPLRRDLEACVEDTASEPAAALSPGHLASVTALRPLSGDERSLGRVRPSLLRAPAARERRGPGRFHRSPAPLYRMRIPSLTAVIIRPGPMRTSLSR